MDENMNMGNGGDYAQNIGTPPPGYPTPLLDCRDIRKTYGGIIALNGLNLTLGRGKIVGLLGPNGSGKTTLIKSICGLLVPDSGSITIAGMNPGIETKAIVSYLPERNSLSGWMKVSEMVEYFRDFYKDFSAEKAYDMLNRLQVNPKAKFSTLSKGTREKVQLVLVMSRDAQLYVLDEPIGGVDPAARDFILNTIISNYSENSTVLLSTHLITDIERILDEVVFINQGHTVMHMPLDALREQEGKSVDQIFREVFKC